MSSYIPPQHGAWAFLGLPVLLGAVVAPWSPLLVVLTVAWVAAYPLSYAAFGLVRARRPERFRRPFVVWATVVAPAAALLVVWRPWLLWVGLVYVVLFSANLAFARQNRERAVLNDLVFVIECAGVVWVTWAVAAGQRTFRVTPTGGTPTQIWLLTVVCALVLAGSTIHVKSLIRERRKLAFALASKGVALASVAVAVWLAAAWGWPRGLWLVLPFLVLACRAFLLGRRPLRPGQIGIIELCCFLLVPICAVLA